MTDSPVARLESVLESVGEDCPGPPGRLSVLSVFLCKSVFYGAFVGACRALNSQKRRFSARAVCTSAAAGGHLALLRWARANGCPWDEFTCTFAAGRGHLAVLQWLRANGCPWEETECCLAAAACGRVGVLRWARANGCSWDTRTCSAAAGGGSRGRVCH
jgi:hypothetical protein